jgi:hypothetical protein
MKTPPWLPTMISAVVLTIGLVVALPTSVLAADRGGTPGYPDTSPQGTVPPNDNYRANYFTDYHVNPGNTGTTTGTQGTVSQPNDYRGQSNYRDQQRDPIDWRNDGDASRSMYDPFAREMQRFRGEMGTRYR